MNCGRNSMTVWEKYESSLHSRIEARLRLLIGERSRGYLGYLGYEHLVTAAIDLFRWSHVKTQYL